MESPKKILLKEMSSGFLFEFSKNEILEYYLPDDQLGLSYEWKRALKALLVNIIDQSMYIVPIYLLREAQVSDDRLSHVLNEHCASGLFHAFKKNHISFEDSSGIEAEMVKDFSWISINLGGACNSFCKFCYTEWGRNLQLSTTEVKKVLQSYSKLGSKSIIFTGGEPTIRTDFLELLEYSHGLGFREIGLQTNGRKLKEYKYLERILNLGINSLLVSAHGHKSEIHDKITNSSGSFYDLNQALKNIELSGVYTVINIVICKDNYSYLTNIVEYTIDFFKENTFSTIRFSYPIYEGAAFENKFDIFIAFEECIENLKKATDLAVAKGFDVEIFGIPKCVFVDDNLKIVNSPTQNSNLLSASFFIRNNIIRGENYIKLSKCKTCIEMNNCPGFQLEYLKQFPLSINHFSCIE